MPKKQKSKFDISPGTTTPPVNTSPYWGCNPMTGGAWRIATRNNSVPADNEGRGWTGKVYVGTGLKLCAPDPPFSQDDGGFETGKKGKESKMGSSSNKAPSKKTAAKKAPAKKAPAKKAAPKNAAVKKTTTKSVARKKAPIRKSSGKKP